MEGVEAAEGGDDGEGGKEERGSDQPSEAGVLGGEQRFLGAQNPHAPSRLALHRRSQRRVGAALRAAQYVKRRVRRERSTK